MKTPAIYIFVLWPSRSIDWLKAVQLNACMTLDQLLNTQDRVWTTSLSQEVIILQIQISPIYRFLSYVPSKGLWLDLQKQIPNF